MPKTFKTIIQIHILITIYIFFLLYYFIVSRLRWCRKQGTLFREQLPIWVPSYVISIPGIFHPSTQRSSPAAHRNRQKQIQVITVRQLLYSPNSTKIPFSFFFQDFLYMIGICICFLSLYSCLSLHKSTAFCYNSLNSHASHYKQMTVNARIACNECKKDYIQITFQSILTKGESLSVSLSLTVCVCVCWQ